MLPILAPVLLARAPDTVGGGSFVRTAFLNEGGNDSSARLNDPMLPFVTFGNAFAALAAAYPISPTTIRLQSPMSVDAPGDLTALNTVLANGLTLCSADGTVMGTDGALLFGTLPGSALTLDHIALAGLTKVPHVGYAHESAGTITGDVTSTIGLLILDADTSTNLDGMAGSQGPDVTASPGGNGSSGTTPGSGATGGVGDSFGSDGADGSFGDSAWDVTLLGSMTVTTIDGAGQAGGAGGDGGAGGVATGGNGGNGGDATDDGNGDALNGGDGGNGGDASSVGGNGGNGGNGGDGSHVYAGASVTIGALNGTGGGGGALGSGGIKGSATAGAGGAGGMGFAGGGQGQSGSDGSAVIRDGTNGTAGTTGAPITSSIN